MCVHAHVIRECVTNNPTSLACTSKAFAASRVNPNIVQPITVMLGCAGEVQVVSLYDVMSVSV